MAKNSKPSKGQTGKTTGGSGTSKRSHIGDSKGSMENLRKAMEIPPKTISSDKSKKK